jgi:hypothetical protein
VADFKIRRGDTLPTFTATIVDGSGNAVNLTGGTVTFVARLLTATSPSINAAATIVTPATGSVSYTPTATDTSVAGQYMVEWHYTLAGGAKGTYPADGYQELLIEEDLITPGGARLVSLGDIKDHLRIPDADRSHDARLVKLLDGSTPVIEHFTGPLLVRQYESERYDGGGAFISVRHRPLISVENVTEYRGPIPYVLTQAPTPDLGTIYSYTFETSGRITRRTVGGGITPFPPGLGQVYVSYTAGYTSTPVNVREAVLELIRLNYQRTEQGIRQGLAGGDRDDDLPGTLMLGFFVPPRVRELLAPNRRHPSVA